MATYSLNHSNERFPSFESLKNAIAGNVKRDASLKKYDESYTKESEASFAGVFLFVAPILFTVFSFLSSVQYDGLSTFIQVMAVGGLVMRVIATKWISTIATEQNRSTSKWMALSFFLPAISLIIIGQTKKLHKVGSSVQQTGYAYNAQSVFQRTAAKEKWQMAS